MISCLALAIAWDCAVSSAVCVAEPNVNLQVLV